MVCDTTGIIYRGRSKGMNLIKEELAAITNPDRQQGSLADALQGRRRLHRAVGPQRPFPGYGEIHGDGPIVFALANPDPEIHPKAARAAGALVVATGRADFANQVNNCLAFPGIFRGALDIRARRINDAMNIAAAHAIADLAGDRLSPNYILPEAMDFRVPPGSSRGRGPGRHGNRHRPNPDRARTGGPPYPGVHLRRAAVDFVSIGA